MLQCNFSLYVCMTSNQTMDSVQHTPLRCVASDSDMTTCAVIGMCHVRLTPSGSVVYGCTNRKQVSTARAAKQSLQNMNESCKITAICDHRRNYIEARGGSCLLLISWSFQLEQPCAFNEIESFVRIHSVRVYKATFNSPKNMTPRQYSTQYCTHRRISNRRTEDIYNFNSNTLARVLVYDRLTSQISRWDSSQSVPWRDKDDVTLTWHVSHVVSTFCWNKSCHMISLWNTVCTLRQQIGQQ